MITRAEAKYIRISPFKVRPVTKLVKGQKVDNALNVLKMTNKKAAFLIRKVVQSAAANAKNLGYQIDQLFISGIRVNEGPTFKRFRAASFGRASQIRKRTAHIIVELDTPEKLIEKVKIDKTKKDKVVDKKKDNINNKEN